MQMETGFSTCDGDCLDTVETTYPGAAENELGTQCMSDADGDGYGDSEPFEGVTPWE